LKETNANQESTMVANPKTNKKQSERILLQNRNKKNQLISQIGVNTDFSLKIMKIEGSKVRVQLWDQGAYINPKTTF
jgi:hypothetical protein